MMQALFETLETPQQENLCGSGTAGSSAIWSVLKKQQFS
jgi:hypothetical protein